MKKTAINYGLDIERGAEYEVKDFGSRFYLVNINGEWQIRHRDIFDAGFVDYRK